MSRTTIIFLAICSLVLATFLIWGDAEKGFEQQLWALASHHLEYAVFSFALLVSDVVLPVPNSIILYANGYVLGTLEGAGLSLLALMTGAVAGYLLGMLTSYGRRAATDTGAVSFWKKYGILAILVTRGIPVISESICILGGHIRMPFGKYMLMNLLGYAPLALIFALFGRFGYDQNAFLLSVACMFGIAGLFWWRGRKWLEANRAEELDL